MKVCMEMFVLWQVHEADGGTYDSLKRRFDMFSVFAGRNPLVSISVLIAIGMCAVVCCQYSTNYHLILMLFPTGFGRS